MSTQQQIDAYQSAIDQKQEELAGQEFTLRVLQEDLAKAEQASSAARRAQGPRSEATAAQRQAVRDAENAESNARIAASQTSDNIAKLQGSIRYNTAQKQSFEASRNAQPAPTSTVGDNPVNVASNAAEVTPAPMPVESTAQPPVVPSEQERTRLAAEAVFDPRQEITEAVFDPRQEITESVFDPGVGAAPEPVATESVFDPRQEITESVFDPGPVATNNPWTGVDAEKAAAWDNLSPADQEWIGNGDPTDQFILARAPDGGSAVAVTSPADEDIAADAENADSQAAADAAAATVSLEQLDAEAAAAKAAALDLARAQNTIANQRGNKNNADWRVKLRLAPLADYLYKATNPGILSPLAGTDGVLFPYTPTINTSYRANYSAVDITHSNYKGYFYQNSSVEPVTISCPFTAQSTAEADYLLAVIHFFKSATKMFYGQDPQRGSPPPLVYLTGLGQFQFNEHPCVLTSFTYDLPADVDYVRARSPNVNNSNMLQQRQSNNSTGPGTSWGGGLLGGFVGGAINRLASSKLLNGQSLPFGGMNTPPAPEPIASNALPTYVPTKMTINITLLPVVSRQAQSQRFSVRQYANGDLLKGGMW